MRLLIIDNYDSFVYNLVQIVEQAGVSDYLIRKNDNLLSLNEFEFDKVLISPGPGIANEAGQLLEFIRKFYRTKSILGICLGHEAIAEVFGASIVQLPEPLHGIKNEGEVIEPHYIFNHLPERFTIGHYHSWILDESTMPSSLNVIMRDENCLIMGIRHQRFDVTGLMFHPESVMTEYGQEMVENWLRSI